MATIDTSLFPSATFKVDSGEAMPVTSRLNALRESQMGDIKFRQAQQEEADNMLLRQAYNTPDPVNFLAQQGRGDLVPAVKQSMYATQEAESKLKTQQLAYDKAHHERIDQLIGDVTRYTTADQANSALDSMLEKGEIDPQTHSMYRNIVVSTPWPQAKTQILGGLRTIQEQFESMQPQEPKLGTYQPGDYTTASWAKFTTSKNPADLQLKPTASATAAQDDKNVVARTIEQDDGTVLLLNKFGEQIGTTKGKKSAAVVKADIAKEQLVKDLDSTIAELTEAVKPGGLIEKSTGSGIGRAVDVGANIFGATTEGQLAIASLQPIYDKVLKMVPRFEGPQSDKDTQSYREAAGQLANPSLPNKVKMAAAKTILRLMNARKDQFTTKEATDAGVTSTARTVVRTGTANGKKVVQYSDGSVEYAP